MADKAGTDTSSFRKAVLSYWTVAIVGLSILAGHVRWYIRGGPAAEVFSGFGAALVVLGIWIAARPYLRVGLQKLVSAAVPPMVIGGMGYGDEDKAIQQRQDAAANAKRDIVAERVIAVAVIVIGTVLNGYGPVIARGLRHMIALHAMHRGLT